MQLKNYQRSTLAVIKDFFEKVQGMEPAEAYLAATESEEVQLRLGKFRNYHNASTENNVPQAAIKVPTGGGKTILAVESIKLIAEAQGVAYPFVLWFTPSDTICRQTAEALKKTTHPYRKTLDAVFGGNVRVYGIDEKFTITPSDIANNVCIVVTTAQAFRHEQHEKYNVYRNNEHLETHFEAGMLEDGMEAQENDLTKPKFSFANLIIKHHPIMIVDEAHKMVSNLSSETIEGLRPSAILELTATPTANNNLLYNVRASELYDEQMIKLPIEVTEVADDWSQAVLGALAKRKELEEVATRAFQEGRGGYLRPIALFQAQAKTAGADVTVDTLKKFLVETANIAADEIAVVTGDQKELDGVDVTNPSCPIRYVITVQALKEGWDCPSAYVLCSVANVHSNTDTVQLLGRVMRQPQAKRRIDEELNKSYAFVMSKTFNAAVDDLVVGLQQKGFDNDEALAAILVKTKVQPDLPLFENPDAVKLTSDEAAKVVATLPRAVQVIEKEDGSAEIAVADNVSPAVQQAVISSLVKIGLAHKAQEFQVKVAKKKVVQNEAAPCKTQSFKLPKLYAVVQDEFVFDADDAMGVWVGNLAEKLPLTLAADDFQLGETIGKSTELVLNGNKIIAKSADAAHQMFLDGFSGVIDETAVVNALDAIVVSQHFSHAEKRHWIVGVVHDLCLVKQCQPEKLYCYRYHLKRVLESKLADAYRLARNEAYQSVFSFAAENTKLDLDFDDGFAFDENLYKNELPAMQLYRSGTYLFTKHYLGPNKIPAFSDRVEGGEEFQCARAIDQNAKVRFWLRNAEGRIGSFRLPVASSSNNWFYPDFVGMLNDGRLFVVEYKGEHLKTNADTVEKTSIGKLWASKSDKCLYKTVFKNDHGKTVEQQLEALFA